MARINNLTNFLTDVAAAIKTKKGSEVNIPAANFDTEILNLPSQGTYQTKSITIAANTTTTVTPDQGYDAIEELVITTNVPINQLQTKSYTFTQNTQTTLTPEQGYQGFSSVDINVNVPTSSGDVKLFETEQAMQADPNPSEGDLAVVYRSEIQDWDGQSNVTGFTFPSIVVLSSAATGYCYGDADEIMIDGNVESEYASFRVENWKTEDEIYVQYESQDGLTYTRTDGGEETISFENAVTFRMFDWEDVCGNFLQTGGKCFEGLHEYQTNLENDYYISFKPGNCLTVTSRTEGAYIYTDTVSINSVVDIYNLTTYNLSDLVAMLQRIKTEQSLSGTDYFIIAEVNNSIIAYYMYGSNNPVFDENGLYLGMYMASGSQTVNKYSIDLENSSYSLVGTETTVLLGNNNNHYGFAANTLGNKFTALVNYQGTGTYRCQTVVCYRYLNYLYFCWLEFL